MKRLRKKCKVASDARQGSPRQIVSGAINPLQTVLLSVPASCKHATRSRVWCLLEGSRNSLSRKRSE